jgi:hypothetical protein
VTCDGFGLTKMCLSHEENSSVSVEVEGGAVRWHNRTASGAGEANGVCVGGGPPLARRAS